MSLILVIINLWNGQLFYHQCYKHFKTQKYLNQPKSILLILVVKKNWFARRANQWPLVRETLFSVVPPSNSLVSVADPWRLFELTWCPRRTLALPRALLPELQRKDTVRCAALGAEVPGHCQQQLMQTLIVRLLKMHLFSPILDCEKSTE